jgi:hypothetical protein
MGLQCQGAMSRAWCAGRPPGCQWELPFAIISDEAGNSARRVRVVKSRMLLRLALNSLWGRLQGFRHSTRTQVSVGRHPSSNRANQDPAAPAASAAPAAAPASTAAGRSAASEASTGAPGSTTPADMVQTRRAAAAELAEDCRLERVISNLQASCSAMPEAPAVRVELFVLLTALHPCRQHGTRRALLPSPGVWQVRSSAGSAV